MALDEPDTESIYDLIYVDRQRVSSYFAQLFGEDGTIKTITRTSDLSDATGGSGEGSIKVATVKRSFETKTAQSAKHEYDPAWLIPLTVMDRLDELGRLHRDLLSAPIGALVLIEGQLEVLDIRMLHNLWTPLIALFQAQVEASPIPDGPKAQRHLAEQQKKKIIKDMTAQFAHIPDILKGLPHAIQATVNAGGDQAWCTLSVDNLVVGTDDLALKHGTQVQGSWYLLGILDALPDQPAPPVALKSEADNSIKNVLRTVIGMGRTFFGRPADCFGVTPVLIFRALADRSSVAASSPFRPE